MLVVTSDTGALQSASTSALTVPKPQYLSEYYVSMYRKILVRMWRDSDEILARMGSDGDEVLVRMGSDSDEIVMSMLRMLDSPPSHVFICAQPFDARVDVHQKNQGLDLQTQ